MAGVGSPVERTPAGATRGCVDYGGGQGAWGLPRGGPTHPGGEGEGPGNGVEVPSSGEKRARPLGDSPCFHSVLMVSTFNSGKFYLERMTQRDGASVPGQGAGGFPGGPLAKNPPAHSGDTGSGPGSGRFHMPWGS